MCEQAEPPEAPADWHADPLARKHAAIRARDYRSAHTEAYTLVHARQKEGALVTAIASGIRGFAAQLWNLEVTPEL